MRSTDPTADTMVISTNVSPEITQNHGKKLIFHYNLSIKALERNVIVHGV